MESYSCVESAEAGLPFLYSRTLDKLHLLAISLESILQKPRPIGDTPSLCILVQVDPMTFSTTTKPSKRVSWACPLVKSPSCSSPAQYQQSSSTFVDLDACDPSQSCRPAADSLRDILQNSSPRLPSGSRHDSLNVGNALPTNTLSEKEREAYEYQEKLRTRYEHREAEEKSRYAQRRFDREQQLLYRDAYYEDPSPGRCWTAACKFVDVLASRDGELERYDRFLKSDLPVTLFVHRDLTFWKPKFLIETLLIPLVINFPRVENFRFAVFFSKDLVEEKWKVPMTLKYLLGTFEYMHRTASLEGAITEMEKKFVRRQLHEMRRRRFDHVQIHEDSLKDGILIPKLDLDDVNISPMESHLLVEAPRSIGTRPVDVVWPKEKDEIWKAPGKAPIWV